MPDKGIDGMLIAFLVAIRIGLKKTSSNIQARVQRSGSEEPGGVSPWASYFEDLGKLRGGLEEHSQYWKRDPRGKVTLCVLQRKGSG